MGHYSGTKYTLKLNQDDSSYQDILTSMQEEINQQYKKDDENPGETFSASMDIKRVKVIYISSGYKTSIFHGLSPALLKKIEKNINTKPEVCYYFSEDKGESNGAIESFYGYANKVAQYLADAGYTNNYDGVSFYNEKGIERFHECIDNKEELAVVIKEGEEERLRRELLGEGKEINELTLIVRKTKDSMKGEVAEKWLAYWLVYGTDNKYKTKVSYSGYEYLNLKEFLYNLDAKHYEAKLGRRVLKEITRYGVEFKEGLDSIEGKFRTNVRLDSSGYPATKELIEKWYQENKEEVTEVPQFTKDTAYYLRDNYPATFEKFKIKLQELHNRHVEMKALEEKKNLFSSIKRKM